MPRLRRTLARALLLLGAAPCLSSPAPAQAPGAAAALTPEMSLTLRTPSDLQFSPDGGRLAFVVTEPPRGTLRQRHIWLLDTGTLALRQFTNSAKSEWAPRFSPDGTRLTFLSDRGDFTQIYVTWGGRDLVIRSAALEPMTEGQSAWIAADPRHCVLLEGTTIMAGEGGPPTASR